MKKINELLMFPINLLIMVLMGIFFGIRYVIKETKYFFRKDENKMSKKFKDWDWRVQIIIPVAYSIIIIIPFVYDFFKAASFIKLISLCLILIGYFFMLMARFQLKDKFSVLPQANKGLETRGIYSVFSHPVYVFSCIATIGVSLYLTVRLPSILTFSCCLLFTCFYIGMQYCRAKKESKKLQEKYGNYYREYKKRTIF